MTGRAWKYAARHDGATIASRYFRLFLTARVPFVWLGDGALESTLEAFRKSSPVRLMPASCAGSAAGANAAVPSARQIAARNHP
jgi:hypothetical protein